VHPVYRRGAQRVTTPVRSRCTGRCDARAHGGKRVQTADGSVDLVRALNDELKAYARHAKAEYATIAT
jgi:hypothetical protein